MSTDSTDERRPIPTFAGTVSEPSAMYELDPDRIPTDATVQLRLPRLITAQDYHEFTHLQTILSIDLGINSVQVSEVGFADSSYRGLIHLDLPAHNQLVERLREYFEEQEE